MAKLDHLKLLKTLIEKQKILYARLSLSDDPQAKKMKENIMKSAMMMGIPSDTDLNFLFSKMTEMIELMEEKLDRDLTSLLATSKIKSSTNQIQSILKILCPFQILKSNPLSVLSPVSW